MDNPENTNKMYINQFGVCVKHINCPDGSFWTISKNSRLTTITAQDVLREVEICSHCGDRLMEENLEQCAVKYSEETREVKKKVLFFFTKTVKETYWKPQFKKWEGSKEKVKESGPQNRKKKEEEKDRINSIE